MRALEAAFNMAGLVSFGVGIYMLDNPNYELREGLLVICIAAMIATCAIRLMLIKK